MSSMRRAATASLVLLSACAPAPDATHPEANFIAKIHHARCGQCHTRVEPETRTLEVFTAELARHKKEHRVRLTETEWTAMLEYLSPVH